MRLIEKGQKLRLHSFNQNDYRNNGMPLTAVRREDNSINDDSMFQEPKGMISLSPPTGSKYVKHDELSIEK